MSQAQHDKEVLSELFELEQEDERIEEANDLLDADKAFREALEDKFPTLKSWPGREKP